MTSPTKVLENEHRLIANVVGTTSALADGLEAGQIVSDVVLQDTVEFMRMFADKLHHGKEEDLLFPILIQKGVPPHGCPIGALTAEHVEGRTLVKGLAQATDAFIKGTASARELLVSSLRGIAQLYPYHIWKENYLLFPMTNKVLSPAELLELYQEFETADERVDKDVRDRLTHWADQVEQTAAARWS